MEDRIASNATGEEGLRALLDELNTSDPEEAVRLVRVMKKYTLRHFKERKTLESLGLDDLDDALQRLRAMKEEVQKVRAENDRILDAYRSGEEPADAQGLHDLFEELYGEMRAIHDELGVDTNQEAVRAVRRLTQRLQNYREAEEKLDELQSALDIEEDPEQTVAAVQNITQQLRTLYDERETLSEVGATSVDEAASMIRNMREQLDDLYDEKGDPDDVDLDLDADDDRLAEIAGEEGSPSEQIEALLDRQEELVDALGVNDPDDVLEIVRNLSREFLARQYGDGSFAEDASGDESVPLLPRDTLAALETMTSEELDDLPVGAVAVDDDGIIRFSNAHAPSLPGLAPEEEPDGRSLFDVLPTAETPLFRGRFEEGVQEGVMDTVFSYTFVDPEAATPLTATVHLHRKADEEINWFLYDVR